jgi:RNA polymerase sigma-70 factor (ECF subfamily)
VVDGLKRGDRAAAGTLYGWYGDCLFREVILPRVPVRELAEDVLRDTFRTVLERINQYQPEENRSIYFWIRRIAINRSVDVYRAYQRSRRLEEAVTAESQVHAETPRPSAGLEQDERRAAIERALGRINPRYAEALRLRLLQDLDREECAERMGVTVGNFDVILHRASAAFRKAWETEEE